MAELIVERVDVWAASIKDQPGGLSELLAGLSEVDANLDFILARRAPDKAGEGVVFVTPLNGDREVATGSNLGFSATTRVESLRVEGVNRKGIVAELTEKLAAEGINLRGLSAAVIGTRFVMYLGFNTGLDAARALGILENV